MHIPMLTTEQEFAAAQLHGDLLEAKIQTWEYDMMREALEAIASGNVPSTPANHARTSLDALIQRD